MLCGAGRGFMCLAPPVCTLISLGAKPSVCVANPLKIPPGDYGTPYGPQSDKVRSFQIFSMVGVISGREYLPGLSHGTFVFDLRLTFLIAVLRHRPIRILTILILNPLVATLKPQSNGPSYSNAVIGNLVHWPLMGGLLHLVQQGGRSPPRPLLAVSNYLTAQPSTASVPTSYYSMWHNNCLWSLKG